MHESDKKAPIVEVLPEKYEFPKLKDFQRRSQNSNGLCWAYAALGCVEFKLIQEYGALDPKRLNFSRVHMRYSCFDNFSENEKSWGINANAGGGGPKIHQFRECIEAYFSRHSGPVYEFELETPSDSTLEHKDFKVIEEDPIKPYFVSDFGVVNEKLETERRIEDVKRAVMNHGAVFANIRYDSKYFKDNTYYAMNERQDFDKESGGHAVLIVGWDDAIKKDCFLTPEKLKRDGAFLVRDTSVEGSPTKDFNYWISYDDKYLLEKNGYVKSVDQWYDEFHLYQHNYFGRCWKRNLRPTTKSDAVCFLVNYKREPDSGKEVIRSLLLFNATVETNIRVVLVRSDKTEETLIPDLCMEEIGYGTYPVQAKDEKGNPKEVFLENGEEMFSLKITYSRNAAFEVPMELSIDQRGDMAKRATPIPKDEQYLLINGQFQDVAENKFVNTVSRLGVKLITEPASETWNQLKNYVDNYVVSNELLPVPHNVKTDARFSVAWEALEEKDGKIAAGIRVLQDTLVNESSNAKNFVLHGKFTITDKNQKEYKINRFYYTGLPNAQLTVENIVPPKEGEYQFVVKGQSPYPDTLVQIVGNEMENKAGSAQNGKEIILGSGSSDKDGAFQIQCSYLGEGKLSVFAKTQQLVSASQTVEFEKNYTEEEEEKETGSGTKIKLKKYYPKNEIGLGQILKLLAIGAIAYKGYEIYVYIERNMRLGYRLLPPYEIMLRNLHLIHPHLDEIRGDENDSGTIFFENDVAGVRRIFKSLENSSIEGITFSMPAGMGLIGSIDKNSVINGCKFVVRDEGSCKYFSPVDKVSGGTLENVQLSVSVMKDKAESFRGIAEVCEAGKIKNCVCRLLSGQNATVMQIEKDFAGLLGSADNTEISNCVFEGNVKAGGNASGIVGNAVDTAVSSCYINASLEGQSASGITAYAESQLNVSRCMAEGSLIAMNSAGAICAGFRSFEANKNSLIENCICRMDIRIREAGKGMLGYAGGIAGVGGTKECGLQIEKCLILGKVSCGTDSWLTGIATSAKSCKNTVAALTEISAGQASAQISVFGDCVAQQCLCYNQIETTDGYIEGAGAVDGQMLSRKKTYQELEWDFTNIWEFSEDGYPYLRNMEGKISEWPFPFIHLIGLEDDGSLKAKANTQITFTGIYGKEMSGICFQSCIFQDTPLQIQEPNVCKNLQENQKKFALNFGTLSETGTYQFTLKYKRDGRAHTVSLPVVITD